MSTRRAYSLPPPHELNSKPERGKCITAICFSWKVITCIVSHVTLVLMVVSYCVGGAYLFQYLEKPHEIEVKKDIHNMRRNLTDRIWQFSDNATFLSESDWIMGVRKDLASFEKQILTAMKADGWDGDENVNKTQWTFAGSLFYSIIVITTIGYGHISPRTDWGKVTTIFYAIIGIPLMLLCLSNIGDIMATSFRFVYWRVCCYICTRTSRRNHRRRRHCHHRSRSRQRSMHPHRYSSRSQPPPFRRSVKLTQRSGNDSGLGTLIDTVTHAYSDPELRTIEANEYDYDRRRNYRNSSSRRHPHRTSARFTMPSYYEDPYGDTVPHYRNSQRFSGRQRNRFRMHERHTIERDRNFGRSKQYIDSIEELNGTPPPPQPMQPMAKRSFSVRSMRAQRNLRCENPPECRELRELNPLHSQTLPRGRSVPAPHAMTGRGRAKSVDPRSVSAAQQHYEDLNEDIIRKTPIIPNRYALDEFNQKETVRVKSRVTPRSQSMPRSAHHQQHKSNRYNPHEQDEHDERHGDFNQHRSQQHRLHAAQTTAHHQGLSNFNRPNSRYGNHLELPELTSPSMLGHTRRDHSHSRSPRPNESTMNHVRRERSPRRGGDYDTTYDEKYMDDYDIEAGMEDYSPHEYHRQRERRQQRRDRNEKLPPSPRIMSPMGFAVKRQIRYRPSYEYDDDSIGEEWIDHYGDLSPKNRPVPIWLCVFLVISYILGGAALFAHWEHWSFLDSAYFCFITLTTIGFGDFVPAKGVQDESEQSIAYCSLYLLFGISLLAMSFNLVQEEFIANVKEVARRLGILKDDEEDED